MSSCWRMRVAAVLPILAAATITGCGSDFVPRNFEVPEGFVTTQFEVRPITTSDAEMDYEAVMESADVIHAALLSEDWPEPDFTLAEDMRQLALKERLFDERKSFTYAVVSPDAKRILGSVYVKPGVGGPDAAVFMWVRKDAFDRGLDPMLERAVREWVDRAWPFEWVVYPGRPEMPAGEVIVSYPVDNVDGVVAGSPVVLDPDVTADGGGSLRISVGEPTTVELYDVGDLDLENATLVYQANLKSENLGGRAYLEMWCTFDEEDDFFSRGLDSSVTGTNDWTLCSTPFFLQAGENPTDVRLNLVVDGAGTVWIDQVRLLKLPLQ